MEVPKDEEVIPIIYKRGDLDDDDDKNEVPRIVNGQALKMDEDDDSDATSLASSALISEVVKEEPRGFVDVRLMQMPRIIIEDCMKMSPSPSRQKIAARRTGRRNNHADEAETAGTSKMPVIASVATANGEIDRSPTKKV